MARISDGSTNICRTRFSVFEDPLFFANSLYLEKPQQIMALLMVIGLSLLVYELAERWVRLELEKQEQTIPNQVGKPTQNPTLRHIFQMFEGIDVLLIEKRPYTTHYRQPKCDTF